MTDEQLRAMARRVISEACDLVRHGCYYAGGEKWRCNGTEDVLADADAVEAAAVAILRVEMDREWMAANHLDDDPTQSFVATT